MQISLVTSAAAFAAEAHKNQKRKASGIPYVNHLLRVAEQAALAGLSTEAVAAALLHDVVEDTPVTFDILDARFPARVVELVRLLTQWWGEDADPAVKQAEKPRYYQQILSDTEAVHLKLLDRADNLGDMTRDLALVRGWAERYLKKTEIEIAPIRAACQNDAVSDFYENALAKLRHAIERSRKKSK